MFSSCAAFVTAVSLASCSSVLHPSIPTRSQSVTSVRLCSVALASPLPPVSFDARMSKKSRKSNGESKKPKRESSDDSEPEADDTDPTATWDCSACTFKNRFEAFKCEICDTRKGTSTRKPRINQNVVQQQVLAQSLAQTHDKASRKSKLRAHSPDHRSTSPSCSTTSVSKRESSVLSKRDSSTEAESPASVSHDPSLIPRYRFSDAFVDMSSPTVVEVSDSEDEDSKIKIYVFKSRNEDEAIAAFESGLAYEKMREDKINAARAEHEAFKARHEKHREQQRRDKTERSRLRKELRDALRLQHKSERSSAPGPSHKRKTGPKTKTPARNGRPPGSRKNNQNPKNRSNGTERKKH